jgi:hypothetical protein
MCKACYFIEKNPKFIIENKKVYVQNINCVFLELREIFKNREVTAMMTFKRMYYRGPDEHCLGHFCIYIYLKKNCVDNQHTVTIPHPRI